jgi:hypothetical protein
MTKNDRIILGNIQLHLNEAVRYICKLSEDGWMELIKREKENGSNLTVFEFKKIIDEYCRHSKL